MFENIALPVFAAVLAGLGWSTVGIWSKWRSGNDVVIDLDKLKKNVIIGAVVGVITWGYTIAQGDVAPLIGTVETFIAALAGYFPIIVIVDKLLIRKEESEEEEFIDEE